MRARSHPETLVEMTDVRKAFDGYAGKDRALQDLKRISKDWGENAWIWGWIVSNKPSSDIIRYLSKLSRAQPNLDEAILLINQAIYHRLCANRARVKRVPSIICPDLKAASEGIFRPYRDYKRPEERVRNAALDVPLACKDLTDKEKRALRLKFDECGFINGAEARHLQSNHQTVPLGKRPVIDASGAEATAEQDLDDFGPSGHNWRTNDPDPQKIEQEILAKWRIKGLDDIFPTRHDLRVRVWKPASLVVIWEIAQLMDRESAEQELIKIRDRRVAGAKDSGPRPRTRLIIQDSTTLLERLQGEGAARFRRGDWRKTMPDVLSGIQRDDETRAEDDSRPPSDLEGPDTTRTMPTSTSLSRGPTHPADAEIPIDPRLLETSSSSNVPLRRPVSLSPNRGSNQPADAEVPPGPGVTVTTSSSTASRRKRARPPRTRSFSNAPRRKPGRPGNHPVRKQALAPRKLFRKLDAELQADLQTSIADMKAANAEVAKVDMQLSELEEQRKILKQKRREVYEQRRVVRKQADEVFPKAKAAVEEESTLRADLVVSAFFEQVGQWKQDVKEEPGDQ